MKGKVNEEQGETWRGSEAIKSLGVNLFHCTPYSMSPPNQSPFICIMLNTTRMRLNLKMLSGGKLISSESNVF